MFTAPKWVSRVGVCAAAVLVVGLPFFVSGEAYPDGTLLRAGNDFKIYAVHHGKKRWLKSGAIFDASGFQWKNIRVVAFEELERIPINNLVRQKDDVRVYALNDAGFKRHILNPDIFTSYGLDWADVAEVAADELTSYPETYLIREANSPKVYFIEGDKRRWVTDVEAFYRNDFDWNAIQVINEKDLAIYQPAGDITPDVKVARPIPFVAPLVPTVPPLTASPTSTATSTPPIFSPIHIPTATTTATSTTPFVPPTQTPTAPSPSPTTPTTPSTSSPTATSTPPITSPPPSSGGAVTVDVRVNGLDSPPATSWGTAITASWSTTGPTQSCYGEGHVIPKVSGGLWGDSQMAITGSVQLFAMAQNSTAAQIGRLQVGIVCYPTSSNIGVRDVVYVSFQDDESPIVSSITAASITSNSATITWVTNETADSQVRYGPTFTYGLETALNSSLATNHAVNLANLEAAATYHYQVISRDATGRNITHSPDQTFTTAAVGSTTSGATCSGLTLSIGKTTATTGETTFAQGETVWYRYTCTPSGRAAAVVVQVVKPDGSVITYNSATNIDTNTLGFGTSNLGPGSYTLRACFNANCEPPTVSTSFSITASSTGSRANFFASVLQSAARIFRGFLGFSR